MNPKDPAAVKDYGFDWSPWINSSTPIVSSDYITASVFSGGGLSITSQSIVTSAHQTICFISSGTADTTYKVTNRITTYLGRVEEQSFDLRVISL